MNHLIGQTLNQFEITQALGQGGMGSVYKAKHIRLDHYVALKIMHPHLAEQPGFAQRFEQEARVAANLDHPGMVKVQDLLEEEDHFFIVMEYIPGINLAQAIQRMHESGQWIPLQEAVQVIHDLALALDHAHNQGVLHRDIKPANVMLKSQPGDETRCLPVITDMGLAKLADSGLVTQMGDVMGSPAYMSPEQTKGGTPGPATDIFSLGVVFYELSVGQRPFQAKTLSEAAKVHYERIPPPRPRSRRPSLSKSIEAIILKTLAPDPADRYASGAELAQLLKEWMDAAENRRVQPIADVEATLMMISQSVAPATVDMGPNVFNSLTDIGDMDSGHIAQQDMLQITDGAGKSQWVNLLEEGTTIGREEGNTIVLDDAKVSRKHLRIERSTKGYQIVDLNSSNGSYLERAKLLPGVHEPFRPNAKLRLGNHQIDLILKGTRLALPDLESALEVAPDDPTFMALLGEMVIAPFDNESFDDLPMQSRKATVRVQIQQSELHVQPGNATSLYISLQNLTHQEAEYKIDLDGIPTEWVPQPPSLRLPAQGHGAITIIIQPPMNVASAVGSHSFSVNVRAIDNETAITVHPAVLVVEGYRELALHIDPARKLSSSPANFTVHVHNQSNVDVTLRLSTEGSDPECFYRFEATQLVLTRGSEQTVQLSVQTGAAQGVTKEVQYNIVVNAFVVEEPGKIYKAKATWIHKGQKSATPLQKKRSAMPPWPEETVMPPRPEEKVTSKQQITPNMPGWRFWLGWVILSTLSLITLVFLFEGAGRTTAIVVGIVLVYLQWRLIRSYMKWAFLWVTLITVFLSFMANTGALMLGGLVTTWLLQWILIRRGIGRSAI